MCGRAHCVELAACAIDGWPFCLVHAEDALERWVAFGLNPELLELLPDPDDAALR